MHRKQNFIMAVSTVIILLTARTSFAFGNLSADEVQSLFAGKTVEGSRVDGASQGIMSFYPEPFVNYFGTDGKVYSGREKSSKSGTWHVAENGGLCIQWKNSKEKCAPVYKDGDGYKQNMKSSKGKIKWTKTYTRFTTGDINNLQDKTPEPETGSN